jgi:hypothetical protein
MRELNCQIGLAHLTLDHSVTLCYYLVMSSSIDSSIISEAMTSIDSTTLTVIHDKMYYFEDGNCVLQVENYLFNVSIKWTTWVVLLGLMGILELTVSSTFKQLHHFILRWNSTFFHDMFSVPQPRHKSGALEGDSDKHPIVCNDSVEAFCAWCWVLYVR